MLTEICCRSAISPLELQTQQTHNPGHEAIITLTEVVQQLLRSVLRGFEVEQFWILVNELCVHGGVQELAVGQDILEERDVGLEKQKKTSRWF